MLGIVPIHSESDGVVTGIVAIHSESAAGLLGIVPIHSESVAIADEILPIHFNFAVGEPCFARILSASPRAYCITEGSARHLISSDFDLKAWKAR